MGRSGWGAPARLSARDTAPGTSRSSPHARGACRRATRPMGSRWGERMRRLTGRGQRLAGALVSRPGPDETRSVTRRQRHPSATSLVGNVTRRQRHSWATSLVDNVTRRQRHSSTTSCFQGRAVDRQQRERRWRPVGPRPRLPVSSCSRSSWRRRRGSDKRVCGSAYGRTLAQRPEAAPARAVLRLRKAAITAAARPGRSPSAPNGASSFRHLLGLTASGHEFTASGHQDEAPIYRRSHLRPGHRRHVPLGEQPARSVGDPGIKRGRGQPHDRIAGREPTLTEERDRVGKAEHLRGPTHAHVDTAKRPGLTKRYHGPRRVDLSRITRTRSHHVPPGVERIRTDRNSGRQLQPTLLRESTRPRDRGASIARTTHAAPDVTLPELACSGTSGSGACVKAALAACHQPAFLSAAPAAPAERR